MPNEINLNSDNWLQLIGRIAFVKEYCAGRAANVTVAVDRVDKAGNKHTNYIQLKSFTPACYNKLKAGNKVRVCGHVQQNKHEKNGEMVYAQDLVADYVEFLEQRLRSRDRETAVPYRSSTNACGTTYRNPMRGSGR